MTCGQCAGKNRGSLSRLGLDMGDNDFIIALAGNPNTGKSTVFNALTGLRQHTGNWPGKTVTRAEGGFSYQDRKYRLVDLPGTYSLLSTSTDEEIARNFILFGRPDATVIVADATRLERNLNLVLQILEITERAVLCLNLMDEAERKGIVIDERVLSRHLGIPVVPTAARHNEGIDRLLGAMSEVASGRYVCTPRKIRGGSKKLQAAITEVAAKIEKRYPHLHNSRWIALRLLEGDQSIIKAIGDGSLETMVPGKAEVN